MLIFVHSRKETAKTARYLKEEALKEDRLAQFMKVLYLSLPMHFLFCNYTLKKLLDPGIAVT